MSTETLGFEDGNVSENIQEAQEHDISRVYSQQQKAKKVRQQTKKNQKHNRSLADMLAELLRTVQHDQLMTLISQQLIVHKIPIRDIFSQFLPFFCSETYKQKYFSLYEDIRSTIPAQKTIESLVKRLGDTRTQSPSLQKIKEKEYTKFIIQYLDRSNAISRSQMSLEEKQEITKEITKELSNQTQKQGNNYNISHENKET